MGTTALLPACSLSDSDDDGPLDASVRITAEDGAITLENGTTERVYYAAFFRDLLPSIEWAQHLDDGPSLAPGQSTTLTAADIWQFDGDGEITLFWWRAVRENGQRVPTEPEAVVVRL